MPTPVAASLTASIVTNLVVTNAVVHVLGHTSRSLREYYAQLHMVAVGMDVTSLLWGVLLAQRVTGNYLGQVVAAVVIQMVHDVAFGAWLNQTTSERATIQLFKRYAAEHGAGILKIDAAFMVVAVTLSRLLALLSTRDVAFVGTFALYTHLLFLDAL